MNLTHFMNQVWTAQVIPGYGPVIGRDVGYGAEPDIRLTVMDSNGDKLFLSAKELFKKGVDISTD